MKKEYKNLNPCFLCDECQKSGLDMNKINITSDLTYYDITSGIKVAKTVWVESDYEKYLEQVNIIAEKILNQE